MVKINCALLVLVSILLFSCQKEEEPEPTYNRSTANFSGTIRFMNETGDESYSLPDGSIRSESYEPVVLTLIGINKRFTRQTVAVADPNLPHMGTYDFGKIPVGRYVVWGESDHYKCWGSNKIYHRSENSFVPELKAFHKEFRNQLESITIVSTEGRKINYKLNFSHAQAGSSVKLWFYLREKPDVSHNNFRGSLQTSFHTADPATGEGSLLLQNPQNYFGDSIYVNMYMVASTASFGYIHENPEGKSYATPYSPKTFRFAVENPSN